MKKLISLLTAFILAFSTFNLVPAFAADDDKDTGPQTAILNNCGQSDDGVTCILKLVVDTMSIGIGILGVIGITIVGVQYLTAGGDEAKTRKAKQRMFEIVIGLVAYVVIYAALTWLLPTFQGIQE